MNGLSTQEAARSIWMSSTFRRALVALVIVTLGGLALATRNRSTERAEAVTSMSVNGDQVDIRADAATWSYLEFGKASVGGSIAPEPVPGRVAFDEARSQPIVAPLPGRVETVTARLGQRVEVGDRLVALRSTALVDVFKEIDLMRGKEAAREKTVERSRALFQLKALPEKDLLAAEQELSQAKLAREAAELKLRSLSVDATSGGTYWLTAPRAGVVVERNVLIGQEVGPDRADPLFVVAELDEVIVTADVPEASVTGITVGQPAAIWSSAAPDRALSGHVEYVGEVVDPLRRMVDVRVRVPNEDRMLRPNAFVRVAFEVGGSAHVLLPAEAVVTDDQLSFVFVRPADQPQRLERRRVTTGRRSEGQVEIIDGLSPGETYVSKGAILLLNAVDLASQ